MALTFLDSDILIQLVRRHPKATRFLQGLESEGATFATTSLNVAEVLRGAQPPDRNFAAVSLILQGLTEVPVGPRASRRYGQLMHALDRAGARVPEMDGLVASTVMAEGGRLVTLNRRHYDRIAGLDLVLIT